MKLAFLMLLFALPQAGHVEKGKTKLDADGKSIVRFHQKFDAMPHCAANGGKVKAWTRESIHVIGHPGDKVSWNCS
jgi:hypothetical protein